MCIEFVDIVNQFLVACYKSLCRSVRRSVRPSVRPSVGPSVRRSHLTFFAFLAYTVTYRVACTRLRAIGLVIVDIFVVDLVVFVLTTT